jgi:hypothetical protein
LRSSDLKANSQKNPVFFPVNGKFGRRAVRSRLPPPPNSLCGLILRFCYPETRENPRKIKLLGEAVSPGETLCPWALGHPGTILRSRRVCLGCGHHGPRPRRPGQSSRRRRHFTPKKPRPNPKRERCCSNFFLGWFYPVFAGDSGKNGVQNVVF